MYRQRQQGAISSETRSKALRLSLLLALVALSACVTARPDVTGQIDFESVADGVRLLEAGRPVLFYRSQPAAGREVWRVNYIHPLWSVAGTVITEDAPADHLHQRGIFWAWRRILVDGIQVADGWVGRDLVLDIAPPRVVTLANGSTEILARSTWRAPVAGAETPIIKENTQIHAFPAADGRRRIELTIELRALRNGVELAGTDDEKGYSGFSLRFAHPDRLRIFSDGAKLAARLGPVNSGASVDFSWDEPSPGWPAQASVTCEVNGQPWTSWILRQELSMQNCAFPGRTAVLLPQDRVLRTRVILTIG